MSGVEQIGPYRIAEQLGAGVLGPLYRAFDSRLERTVALRVRDFSCVEGEEVRAAVRAALRGRARRAASVAHPGLATIYALEEHEGIDLLACEYVSGRTVRELLALPSRRRPFAVARRIALLADALAEAHAAGLAHGRIDADRVRARQDGLLRLVGLADAALDAGGAELAAATVEDDLRGLLRLGWQMVRSAAEGEDPGLRVEAELLRHVFAPVLSEGPLPWTDASALRAALEAAIVRPAPAPGPPMRPWPMATAPPAGAVATLPVPPPHPPAAAAVFALREGDDDAEVDADRPNTRWRAPPRAGSPGGPVLLLPEPENSPRGGRGPLIAAAVGTVLFIATAGVAMGTGLLPRPAWLPGPGAAVAEPGAPAGSAAPADSPAGTDLETGTAGTGVEPGTAGTGSEGASDAPAPVEPPAAAAGRPDAPVAVSAAELAGPPRSRASAFEPAGVQAAGPAARALAVASPGPPPAAAEERRILTGRVSVVPADAVVLRVGVGVVSVGGTELSVAEGDSVVLAVRREGYVEARAVFRGRPLFVGLQPDSVDVTFSANVPARVTVDGPDGRRVLGVTLLTARLPTGRYRIELQPERGTAYTTAADFSRPGGQHRVVKMDFPTSGSLVITVDGTWARVSLNGGPERETPARFDGLPDVPHVLRIVRAGFTTIVDTVRIVPGTVVRRQYRLQPDAAPPAAARP
jgi:hypothetical protein